MKELIEKIEELPDDMTVWGDALTHRLGTIADLKALARSLSVAVEALSEIVKYYPMKGMVKMQPLQAVGEIYTITRDALKAIDTTESQPDRDKEK